MNRDLPGNFPCKCGHTNDIHWVRGVDGFQCWAAQLYIDLCYCKGYRPDNLAYLETQYES